MAFELSMNGRTETFESASEMAEWMDRQRIITPNKKKRRKYKKKQPNKNSTKISTKKDHS